VESVPFTLRQDLTLQVAGQNIKAKIASFDRRQWLGLVQNLNPAHKDNQTFLHAHPGAGDDILKTVQGDDRIARCGLTCFARKIRLLLKPSKPFPITRRQLANPPGLAELTVFYCDCGVL
jgi:hypothetical protein